MIDRNKMLNTYLVANVAPILITGLNIDDVPNAEIIESNCDNSLLIGHYENEKFITPSWLTNVESKKNETPNILIIKELDKITKDEQLKFIELLKYRKAGVFELPKNCVILLTAKIVNSEVINEEIYSLVAHI